MHVYPILMFLGGCTFGLTPLPGEPAPGDSEADTGDGADTGGEVGPPAPNAEVPHAEVPLAEAPVEEEPEEEVPVEEAPVEEVPEEEEPEIDGDVATEADGLFVEGTIHHFELSLDETAIASLALDPSVDVPAVLAYGGETFQVGVHIKGSHSLRTLDEKASFKIDFNDLAPEQQFLGLEHLTLNNMIQDRSMLREHAAYWLYDQMGVPAPRHGYARVEVNGTLFGLYGIVESMDQDFLARRFPSDTEGNLYETAHASGDVSADGESNFEIQHAGDVPAGDDLAELVETLEAASPATFFGVLGTVFDTDELLTFLALDVVMGHDDGYVTSRNNFLLYNAPIAGKWHLLPWGQDQTFDEDSRLHVGYEGQLAARCVTSPDCKAAFDAKLREVADLWETADLAGYVTEARAAVRGECEADPRKEHACSANSLFDFIEMRPASVRAQLP